MGFSLKRKIEAAAQPGEYELIRAVLSGDSDQFSALVEANYQCTYALLYRQVRDEASAQDLAQETFLRAFRYLPKFRFECSFKTWVTRIALNVAHSYFSSSAYRARQRSVELAPAVPDNLIYLPSAQIEKQEDVMLLRRSIGELKPRYREALVLCCFEEKTYKEAAEILGIPEGTLCSRMNKAFEILRKKFSRSSQR